MCKKLNISAILQHIFGSLKVAQGRLSICSHGKIKQFQGIHLWYSILNFRVEERLKNFIHNTLGRRRLNGKIKFHMLIVSDRHLFLTHGSLEIHFIVRKPARVLIIPCKSNFGLVAEIKIIFSCI